MNILPKKRWHVRTRENIARVRRDEAAAAKEEAERLDRIATADREARLNALRTLASKHSAGADIEDTSTQRNADESLPKGHVNLFEDIQDDQGSHNKPNLDRQREDKEEKEKYEKQIGYLTYLGQDTNEALRKQSWYNEVPQRMRHEEVSAADTKAQRTAKEREDPLRVIRMHCPKEKSATASHRSKTTKIIDDTEKRRKKKKHKTSRDEKLRNLEELRKKRLEREAKERERERKIISKLSGHPKKKATEEQEHLGDVCRQKYNSQFNPQIAKQNFR